MDREELGQLLEEDEMYARRREHAAAMAGVLMLQAHENTMAKREEWTRSGGVIVHRLRLGHLHGVQLIDAAGLVCFFAESAQSSADAEAHALQHWINDRNSGKGR